MRVPVGPRAAARGHVPAFERVWTRGRRGRRAIRKLSDQNFPLLFLDVDQNFPDLTAGLREKKTIDLPQPDCSFRGVCRSRQGGSYPKAPDRLP